MLHVRFDPTTRAGLALVLTVPETDAVTADYSRGASLLFSVIGGGSGDDNGDRWNKQPAVLPPILRSARPSAGVTH